MVALTPGTTLKLQPELVQERQSQQTSITPDQSYLDQLVGLDQSVAPDQAPPLGPNLNPTNPAVFDRLAPSDPQNLSLAEINTAADIVPGVDGNSPIFTIKQDYLDQQVDPAVTGNVSSDITPEVERDPKAVQEEEIIKAGVLAPIAEAIEFLRIAEVAQQVDQEDREAA